LEERVHRLVSVVRFFDNCIWVTGVARSRACERVIVVDWRQTAVCLQK
jgi:hypothetical protein